MWWMTSDATEANPINRMRALQNEMNRLFDGNLLGREAFPAVNIWSDAEKIELRAELPGINPKELHVAVLGDTLTIEGEIKSESSDEKAIWHRQERFSGKFSRVFKLPYEVDSSKISAKCADGVLHISMKRVESSKPRKIEIAL